MQNSALNDIVANVLVFVASDRFKIVADLIKSENNTVKKYKDCLRKTKQSTQHPLVSLYFNKVNLLNKFIVRRMKLFDFL